MNYQFQDSICKEEFYKAVIRAYRNPMCSQQYAEKLFSERRPPVKNAIDEFVENLPNGGVVIDLGCGTGKDVAYLRAKSINAIGADISSLMIKQARKLVSSACFIECDFRDLSCFRQHSFDGILSLASIQHVYRSDIANVIKQMYFLLRKTGVILIITKEGHGLYFDKRLGEEFTRPTTLVTCEELHTHLIAQGFNISKSYSFSLEREGIKDKWLAVLAHPV